MARIGEILRDKAELSEAQIDRALEVQRDADKRLGSILVEMGLVDPDVVAEALAELNHVPPAKRAHFQDIDQDVLARLPAKLARQFGAIPLGVSTKLGKTLVVAMRDPTDGDAIETIQFACGMDIRPAAASAFFLDQCIERFYAAAPEPLLDLEAAPASVGVGAGRGIGGVPGAPGAVPAEGGAASGDALPPGAHPSASTVPVRPLPPAPIPTAHVRRGSSGQIAGMVLGLVGFLLGGYAYKRACHGKAATQNVSGDFDAKHAGLGIEFPEGWKYLPGKDETNNQRGMKLRMSLFYRGGTADIPRDALLVGYMDTNNRLPSMSDDQFMNMVKVSARNMRAPGASKYAMSVGQCKASGLRTEQAGECTGTARYKDTTWNIMVVMWLGDEGRVYIAAPLAREPLDESRAWMDPMITSMTQP